MRAPKTSTKSAEAFRTISEVSGLLEVPQHVLRFWESKFPQVRPLKRGGGRRYYRPEDVALLERIRALLYDEGYTIRGVQRLMKERKAGRGGGAAGLAVEDPPTGSSPGIAPGIAKEAVTPDPDPDPARASGPAGVDRETVKQVITELEALRDKLRGVLDKE